MAWILSAMYSCRSSRQTTMSHGLSIPSTLMTSSALNVSVLYRLIVDEWTQMTYTMSPKCVTPETSSTIHHRTHHFYIPVQNCLARTVVKAPKSSHITPILRSLHWLKINERIEYKLLSLTYKVLTTSQPDYLHNLISVHSTCRTRSSSAVTLARPPVSSSLQITNRSFTYASPYLWNQLPSSFRQPHSVHCPPGPPHLACVTSSK